MRYVPTIPTAAFATIVFAVVTPALGQTSLPATDDLRAQKYSPLTQITPANVGKLRVAWRMRTGDMPVAAAFHGRTVAGWSTTPLFANDTLYLGTPSSRILALQPDTGTVKWSYDAKPDRAATTQRNLTNRGVSYWQADPMAAGEPCQKRVYIGTVDGKLHSVDADSGKPCSDFGDSGILDTGQWNTMNRKWPFALVQPPTVFKDTLFLGWAGNGLADAEVSPGTLFALDARTGALRWTFETIPEDLAAKTGMANVTAALAVDAARNVLYVPVNSPSPDYFGGNRLDEIPYATSVTALDVETGKVVWSRQLVHHDLWDYDTNATPVLVDIVKDGATIPALVQTSKQGFLYVLNRHTGEPVYPVEERPVPKSNVPGEVAAPTQPFVDLPQPTTGGKWPGIFRLADWVGLGQCSRTAAGLRDEGRFTPPSLQGTLVYPGSMGGVEWGGGALDPRSQTFVVNASSVAQIYRLWRRADYNNLVSSTETAGGLFPMRGTPYGVQLTAFLNPIGMPCWNPPFGTLSSYDLRTGTLLWRKPFGQVQHWGFYMPESWGSVTVGAPAITASGLIFIGASMDSRVRAIDLKSGEVLWKHLVAAPAAAMPAIYQYKGRQYVAFAAGGNAMLARKVGDEVIAFALP
ncbi:PQQ-binding-like beta-propeller repeat protein [Pseudorhodoplanes sp.]|uniref:outer membrane protein assembly factor BamB family protein n=1 Tax=Pseudorhodoplanes sp. TaxID=1934341 RepID=UPI003D128A54